VNDINNDNSSSNNGLLGKFRERLRLIRINRYRKMKISKGIIEDKDNSEKQGNKVKDKDGENFSDSIRVRIRLAEARKIVVDKKIVRTSREKICDRVIKGSNDLFIAGVVKRIRATSKDRDYGKRYGIGNDNVKRSENEKDTRDRVKEELKVKIIGKIRDNLEKIEAEVLVLESELYFVRDSSDKELELERVNELKREIDDIIGKINVLIEEYNIYRNDYELDDFIYLDDFSLIDDIINYKNVIDSYRDKSDLVKDYKLLYEYIYLYERLDRVKSLGNEIVEENQEKIDRIEIRDKKYDVIKSNLIGIEDIEEKVNVEIRRQNEYFKKLMRDIDKIDSKRYTEYKLKGLGSLIGQSIKYVGLMIVSPLKGVIPSIAISTLVTRSMIRNIRKNMKLEKIDKVYYEAVDFDRDISNKLNDVDYTYYLIDDTMEMVSGLKSDFMEQYNSNIPGYDETLRKIDTMMGEIKKNRYKMDVIKQNLKVSKKINADKMVKVRKLNKSSM
jgi:hypothetical protein